MTLQSLDVNGCDKMLCIFQRFAPRKERGGMAVLAQAEKDQIKARQTAVAKLKKIL